MAIVAAAAALALCLVATAATTAAAGAPPWPSPPNNIAACLVSNGVKNSLPLSPSFSPLLHSSLRYLRFDVPSVGKPSAIVLPASQRDLQHAVLCARNASLATIHVRAGGHSYEGLSYTTENHVPFVVIDVAALNRVRVDPASVTVWAESGATLGELYHAVGRSNRNFVFPDGTCSTLGLGGGFGLLARKHGLAADNVMDATLIDVGGRALTRTTMDPDVFWAIRAMQIAKGGAGTCGAVPRQELGTGVGKRMVREERIRILVETFSKLRFL